MSLSATVTNIARGSLHDGEGIRTVVYLKGCGLRCKWCHNPETLKHSPETVFTESKCIKCGRCAEACPEHHFIEDDSLVFERDGCISCGKCADACPSGAISVIGEKKTSDEILEEIKKDIHFYAATGGGVTFSGGECLLYPDFIAETARKCRELGINVAVESAFFVPWENVEKVIPYVDTFFADVKAGTSETHIKYTGQDNFLIIENIKKLTKQRKEVIIRIPVIPGANDSDKEIFAIAEIVKNLKNGVKYVELLKYNNLAGSKYKMIGAEYTNFAAEPQTDEVMRELAKRISSLCGVKCI